jgi:hypothetical protein
VLLTAGFVLASIGLAVIVGAVVTVVVIVAKVRKALNSVEKGK